MYQLGYFVANLNVAANKRWKYAYVYNTALNVNILKILHKNGIIGGFLFLKSTLKIKLKYYNNICVLRKISIISKPGSRKYWKLKFLSNKFNKNSFNGFFIISTPLGILTSVDCLFFKIRSGEVLLQVII